MRIAIATVVAASLAVGLAFAADAAPARKKQKVSAPRQKVEVLKPPPGRQEPAGFDAMPDHYRFGSDQWWRAMEREGRGGFGDTM